MARVADEVEDVLCPDVLALRLVREGAAAREAVVHGPYELAVAERFAAQVGGEGGGEGFEFAEVGADLDPARGGRRGGRVVVEDHTEDGLCAAGVLDCLRGKEEICVGDCVGIVFAVLWLRLVLGVADIFEEEDYAVDGTMWRGNLLAGDVTGEAKKMSACSGHARSCLPQCADRVWV